MAQTKKLPLFRPAYQNADETENNEDPIVLYDGWLDDKGGFHRRPGLAQFADLGTNQSIDAEYWWSKESKLIAVSAGQIFSVNANGVAMNHSGATIPIGVKASFAINGDYLIIAAGGPMVYLNFQLGITTATYITDPQAPSDVTHVGFVDGYTIANNVGTDQFNWSDLNSPLSWSALSFATAEGGPDFIQSFIVKDREITFFGQESIEAWENVGDSTTFSRVPGGFLQDGIGAANSVIADKNNIFWLSPNSEFNRYAGRAIDKVSSPYDKELQSFRTISDCRAERLEMLGRTFFVFIFPTENRTLVYNVTDNNWAEWGKWNPSTTSYDRWIGNCIAYSPAFREVLVGDRSSSIIYKMSEEYLTDNGALIRFSSLSGHIDHGYSVRKRSNRFRMRVKVGASSDLTTESKIMIRWKDNNKSWSNLKEISLGAAGSRNMIVKFEPRGIYETRQWEISATDVNSPIVLSDAEEDLDFLR